MLLNCLSILLALASLLMTHWPHPAAAQCPTISSSLATAVPTSASAASVASLIVNEGDPVDSAESMSLTTTATTAAAAAPEDSHSWTELDGSCYRWFPGRLPWFPAEAACRSYGGHLASVASDRENRLVGRLGGCRDAWIGRFATDYHRVTDPDSYEWTDGSSGGGFSRHNFSRDGGGGGFDPHMGAVLAAGLAWANAYYHDQLPYVCEVPAQRVDADSGDRCPKPFAQHSNSCYWLSDFSASFVEASLHCEQELQCHLASVHSPGELAFLATLELDSDTCQLSSVWLGLIKQNPCRQAPPEERKQVSADINVDGGGGDGGHQEGSPCYQWTDFSGQHAGYPPWQEGQPLLNNWKVNCASLTDGGLVSERCHTRRRFVCKRPL